MHRFFKFIWIPLFLVLLTSCETQVAPKNDASSVPQAANSASGGEEANPAGAISESGASQETTKTNSVIFEIDYGDGATLTVELPVVEAEISLEALMKSLAEHPHGPELLMKGSGVTCFIESIGGMGTNSGKGWQYEVNGVHAERGVGQTTVKAGDRVQWKYDAW